MRTTLSTSGTTGKTRGASIMTTLAAIALALPVSGLLGGTAFATQTDAGTTATADRGNSAAAQAAADLKKADADAAKADAAKADAAKTDAAKAAKPADAAKADAAAPTDTAKAAKPADFIGPVIPAAKAGSNSNTTSTPFTNAGGVTTGSNTTKYEVVNGRSGSPAKGGGQPSGNVYSPQPYSNADQNNTGANDTSASNPYRSTRDGAPSLNGNGGGKQVGQPCAGCVGKADNKNPKGQAPGGSDHNSGYECDRNHGIGRSNPAHTGCTSTPTTQTPTLTVSTTCTSVSVTSTVKSLTSVTISFVNAPSQTITSGLGLTYTHSGYTSTVKSVTASNGTLTRTADQDVSKCGSNDTPKVKISVSCGVVSVDASEAIKSITVNFASGPSETITSGLGKTYSNDFAPKVVTSASVVTVNGGTDSAQQTKSCNPGNACVPTATQASDCTEHVEICHATGSNKFVVISPSKEGVLNGHVGHQDGRDVIPAFDYTEDGKIKHFAGQNWTPGMVLSAENCPNPPKLCPGTTKPMPASGNVADCNPPVFCPGGTKPMPASGNVADCNPPVLCPGGTKPMPASGNVADCNPPVLCPGGTKPMPASGNVADCNPPVLCPGGTKPMPASGNVADCNPPVVCPNTAMVGPIVPGTARPGCDIGGENGGGAQGPGTTPTPGVISNGGQPQPVLGGTPTPAVVSARPTALPFTGSNASLLAEGAALLLLIGGGLVLATRRKADAAV